MSLVVLLILAIVWAVFLVPQVLRHRAERTPADTIGAFRNQLHVLERTTPGSTSRAARPAIAGGAVGFGAPVRATRPVAGYRPVSQKELVRRRRQSILLGLLGAMGVTLLAGLLVHPVLLLHLALDVLFVVYCGLLVRARNVAAEREMKVRYLPGTGFGAPEPQFLLSQSGS